MLDHLKVDTRRVETCACCQYKVGDAVFVCSKIKLVQRILCQTKRMAFIKAHTRFRIRESSAPVKIIGIEPRHIGMGPKKRIAVLDLRLGGHSRRTAGDNAHRSAARGRFSTNLV